MKTYLTKWMPIKSNLSLRLIESYSLWNLVNRDIELRPSNPSTLTEAIIEYDIKVGTNQGIVPVVDPMVLHTESTRLPLGHITTIRGYENNVLVDEESMETAKIPNMIR
jgi:hypothetical protein